VPQAILDLSNEDIVGYELLSRGPSGALEMPGDFFRVALECDMLAAVDLSCLKTCAEAGRALLPRGKVHLNLFPSTILGTSVERLADMLASDDDVTFCIEISEQQFIGDPACLREHVSAFRNRGIEVSIDDVGFGRSCLETLVALEPDVVKIDRRYVDGAASDPQKSRLLARLVRVSRTLGARIIAEGIENRDDLELLRNCGVEYGQGWLWGKPDEATYSPEARVA
jgi:EAL domain-containing protein (putative c-di-GMP-specific phosphodiesterase class I)